MLPPDIRRAVAEACGETPRDKTLEGWNPDDSIRQYYLLITKLAQVIEGVTASNWRVIYQRRLCEALATNDTNALEALLAELIHNGGDA